MVTAANRRTYLNKLRTRLNAFTLAAGRPNRIPKYLFQQDYNLTSRNRAYIIELTEGLLNNNTIEARVAQDSTYLSNVNRMTHLNELLNLNYNKENTWNNMFQNWTGFLSDYYVKNTDLAHDVRQIMRTAAGLSNISTLNSIADAIISSLQNMGQNQKQFRQILHQQQQQQQQQQPQCTVYR